MEKRGPMGQFALGGLKSTKPLPLLHRGKENKREEGKGVFCCWAYGIGAWITPFFFFHSVEFCNLFALSRLHIRARGHESTRKKNLASSKGTFGTKRSQEENREEKKKRGGGVVLGFRVWNFCIPQQISQLLPLQPPCLFVFLDSYVASYT